MSVQKFCHLVAVGLLTTMLGTLGAHAEPDLCRAPDEAGGVISAMPRVQAALKPGGVLRVLAVGSATMFGPEATLQPGTLTSQAVSRAASSVPIPPPMQPVDIGPSPFAFPRRMAAALQDAVPGLRVEVVLRGGRGLPAADMLDMLRKELKPGGFQLVLWQTGTVEAVRNTPPGEFAQVLSDGAEAVEAAGADLVLIDPQYSRFLQTNSNLDPYIQALEQVAAMPGILLFHRFDLMRSWANDGQIDLERTPRPERQRAVETLHQCLGSQLARMILAGARS